MNNLAKNFSVIVILTLIAACGREWTTEAEVAPIPVPEPDQKSLEINFNATNFNATNFEVQFDKSLIIPFGLIKDDGHSVTITLSTPPLLGDVIINVNTFEYTPSGELGEDTFILSITNNEKTIEQKFEILVSDRSPYMVLSEPRYSVSTELEDYITVWGYNLGEQQSNSTIELCDLSGECIAMPSIVHWKNTKSNLPSTLEHLSANHKIQEVKFSIPKTSHGDKFILIKNRFGSSTLPFTVRPNAFEIAFNKTDFEVQFDQDLTIPLNIILDENPSVEASISILPSLGSVTIIDNKVNYLPSGALGKDSLTISITEANKTVEQKITLLVSDRAPHLAFSDLISGPSTGLGDKKGSGVIVTVWGFKLGDAQNGSTIELCDLNNVCAEAAHVYYWKNADGQLPSGPANLYESHGMQEIAFSIPNISNGEKQIKVTNDYGTSTLQFTVRHGAIYHVTSRGHDDSGDGTFEKPWLTVAKADSTINAGSTLYIHNVTTGSEDTDIAIYNNKTTAMSTLDAQFSYIAYPNTRPEVIGARGFNTYTGGTDTTVGFIISKLAFFTAEADEDENNQPLHTRNSESKGTYAIEGTKDGRAIGNFITDAHPNDPSGACPDGVAAAITGGAKTSDKVSNFKVLGNHIKEYGCDGTTRFQHTTYLTIRSADKNRQLVAPEMGWNFLQDNKTSSGLHYFDESKGGVECGQFTTPFNIHDNVVINQAGPAITFGANCPVNTTFNFYNNLAINVGIKADFDDNTINGNISSAVYISIGHEGVTAQLNFDNNMFYQWNVENRQSNLMACVALSAPHSNAAINWNSNICYTKQDLYFIRSKTGYEGMEAKFSGNNNGWYSEALSSTRAVIPVWGNNPLTNKSDISDISFDGVKLIIKKDSPLNKQVINSPIIRDIYGKLKVGQSTIGPVQASVD
jgi:hypothetical protein